MYQVIARKYRPQTFQQLVGQHHVKQTLENALTQGRVGHGYIFAGQRGTGKTTVARILAKSLNCHRSPGVGPCLECSSCREIAASACLDVLEIDAASNRGIDDVRELRENVRYRPSRDRHKIFIIDEAHQITEAAFNALLKTLEEPPEWVIFILCTTEAHKIPATIASRCQIFTFHMVDFEQVIGRLQWICEQEKVTTEPDSLSLLALAGDGSIRDSLSTLDQAIACFGNNLQAAEVRQLLGVVSGQVLEEVTGAILDQSSPRMLDLVQQLTAQGQHPQQFCRELARYFRNLLVARLAGADSRLITATGEERRRLSAFAPRFSEEDLTRYLQLVLNLYRDLHSAPHPRFHLEIGLVKLVHAGRLMSLEEALAGAPAAGPAAAPVSPGPRLAPPVPDATAESTGPGPPLAQPEDFQHRLVAALRLQGDDFTADAVEHSRVESSNGEVVFHPPPDLVFSLESATRSLAQLSERLLEQRVRIRVALATKIDSRENVAAGPAPGPAAGLPTAATRAMAHPQVQRVLAMFGGQLRDVRDLKEPEP